MTQPSNNVREEIEKLNSLLHLCAGYISANEEFQHLHPETVLDWIKKEMPEDHEASPVKYNKRQSEIDKLKKENAILSKHVIYSRMSEKDRATLENIRSI